MWAVLRRRRRLSAQDARSLPFAVALPFLSSRHRGSELTGRFGFGLATEAELLVVLNHARDNLSC